MKMRIVWTNNEGILILEIINKGILPEEPGEPGEPGKPGKPGKQGKPGKH